MTAWSIQGSLGQGFQQPCWGCPHKGQGKSLKSTGPPRPASASRRLMITAMAASSLLGLLEPGSSMSMLRCELSPGGVLKENAVVSHTGFWYGFGWNWQDTVFEILRTCCLCVHSYLLIIDWLEYGYPMVSGPPGSVPADGRSGVPFWICQNK